MASLESVTYKSERTQEMSIRQESEDFYADLTEIKILLGSRYSKNELCLLDRAWDLVGEKHKEEKHFSGKPYTEHLFDVAHSLAAMDLDLATVVGGILHGVMRHGVQADDLEVNFGEDITKIVCGVSRISSISNKVDPTVAVENLRKMLVAVANDVRVLLVRLIDRLQDMFSLDALEQEQRVIVARETLDVYASLASRLGIEWLKKEFEDLGFRYCYPEAYKDLEIKVSRDIKEGQAYVDRVLGELNTMLGAGGVIPHRVYGRPKHLYSIYKKLLAQNIDLEEVYDKIAFRIITKTVEDCYGTLGIIHSRWTPLQKRIKDYISQPKANGYKSLHTTVLGPDKQYIEVQIRTEDMDTVAQGGVAAHWAYKAGLSTNKKEAELFSDLKEAVAGLQDVKGSEEMLEKIKQTLSTSRVYVITPTGEVKGLPFGSCPIDLAYAIHSQLGDRCVGAKIGGRHVSLRYKLQSGEVVEILTSKTQQPKREWLDFIKTSRAKSRINTWLRSDERERNRLQGEAVCEQEFEKYGTSFKKMTKSGQLRHLAENLNCNSVEQLLMQLGKQKVRMTAFHHAVCAVLNISPESVLNAEEGTKEPLIPVKLLQPSGPQSIPKQLNNTSRATTVISVDGSDGIWVRIAQCCRPLPGDEIVGYTTIGGGVSVHKAGCPNLRSVDVNRLVDVVWEHAAEETSFNVPLYLLAEDYTGLFSEVTGVVSKTGANIIEVNAQGSPVGHAEIRLVIGVRSVEHLNKIIQNVRQLPKVQGFYRM